MNRNRKRLALQTLSASVLLTAGALGVSGVNAATDSTTPEQQTPATPAPSTGTTGTTTTRPGRPGRGGPGGDNHHLQGMDLNPPEVELAVPQSEAEVTAPELVEGAEFYDGQFYGDAVAANRWGTMQVVAVIENGELVDVLIANYPRSTTESDIITRNALPTLISEAIEAQSADIDIVSRATDSSVAFIESLDAALLDAAIGADL